MSDPLKILEDVKDTHLRNIITLIAVATPTMIAIIMFFPEYFVSANIFSLLLIVLGIGFFTIFPTFIASFAFQNDEDNDSFGIGVFREGAFFNGLLLICFEIVFYIFFMNAGFKVFLGMASTFLILVVPTILFIISGIKTKKKSSEIKK